jgi:hypothetical protein
VHTHACLSTIWCEEPPGLQLLYPILSRPLSLLPMLLLPRLRTVMMKFPFRVSHTILLWFRAMVMLGFLSRTPVFLAIPPPPSYCSPSTCPASWRPMPSRECLVPICFFFAPPSKTCTFYYLSCHTQQCLRIAFATVRNLVVLAPCVAFLNNRDC